MAEGRSTSIIVLYPLLRKVKTGLGQDILPMELGEECTPVEIKSSVAEAGMLLLCGMATHAANDRRNEGNLVREASALWGLVVHPNGYHRHL